MLARPARYGRARRVTFAHCNGKASEISDVELRPLGVPDVPVETPLTVDLLPDDDELYGG